MRLCLLQLLQRQDFASRIMELVSPSRDTLVRVDAFLKGVVW